MIELLLFVMLQAPDAEITDVEIPSVIEMIEESLAESDVHDPVAEQIAIQAYVREAEEKRAARERERAEAARLKEEAREAKAQAAYEEAAPAPTIGVPWDEIARCESGYGSNPQWDLDTGNGFYGGLQFEKESWDWAGGQQYAEWPHYATREQQIAVAEQLLSIHPAGIGAWPACADKLGLR